MTRQSLSSLSRTFLSTKSAGTVFITSLMPWGLLRASEVFFILIFIASPNAKSLFFRAVATTFAPMLLKTSAVTLPTRPNPKTKVSKSFTVTGSCSKASCNAPSAVGIQFLITSSSRDIYSKTLYPWEVKIPFNDDGKFPPKTLPFSFRQWTSLEIGTVSSENGAFKFSPSVEIIIGKIIMSKPFRISTGSIFSPKAYFLT